MSLCVAVAWSSQSSAFSQDPYNIWNVNSLVKTKQTKLINKWGYDKMCLKAKVILKHLDADMSLDTVTVKNQNVPGNCILLQMAVLVQ